MLPHPFVEGFVPGDGSSYWAGGFSFLTHGLRARTGCSTTKMPNKDRRFQEALEKAGGEGWLYSEQQLGTISSGISDRRVTQYILCVVEFSTLLH